MPPHLPVGEVKNSDGLRRERHSLPANTGEHGEFEHQLLAERGIVGGRILYLILGSSCQQLNHAARKNFLAATQVFQAKRNKCQKSQLCFCKSIFFPHLSDLLVTNERLSL